MPIFVNNTEIDDDAIFTEMQYHSAENMEAARNAAAQALVVRALMEEEARKQGLLTKDATEELIDAALMKLVEKDVTAPSATTEFCQTYYKQNKVRFAAKDAPGQFVPFEQVEEKIRDYLHTRSVREGIRGYVLNLADNARIAGFDLAASL